MRVTPSTRIVPYSLLGLVEYRTLKLVTPYFFYPNLKDFAYSIEIKKDIHYRYKHTMSFSETGDIDISEEPIETVPFLQSNPKVNVWITNIVELVGDGKIALPPWYGGYFDTSIYNTICLDDVTQPISDVTSWGTEEWPYDNGVTFKVANKKYCVCSIFSQLYTFDVTDWSYSRPINPMDVLLIMKEAKQFVGFYPLIEVQNKLKGKGEKFGIRRTNWLTRDSYLGTYYLKVISGGELALSFNRTNYKQWYKVDHAPLIKGDIKLGAVAP